MVVAGLVLAVAAVFGAMAWRSWRGAEVPVVPVRTGRVVAAVYATGRVDTDQRATVRARLAGPLEAVLVGAGEPVRAGQVVARQDAVAARLAREQVERELDGARAAVAEAEDTAARTRVLVDEGLAPEDSGVQARERASGLRAKVAAEERALALARERESWATLEAPLTGVVSSLSHRAGDALREGDDVLTVVDLSRAYLRVSVDERDVGRVAVGQEVRLVFDAYLGRTLEGRVWRLVPAVDWLTKSSDVLVSLPGDRPPMQLDLTATVNIVTGTVDGALVVPRDALDGSGGRRRLMVVEGDRARWREVHVGACDETDCQVTAGVASGERVVAPLGEGLAEGARVRVR